MNDKNKFYGFYRGEVMDDQDPLKQGRVKVKVFGVFDNISTEDLPWSIFADPWMGGQSGLGGFWVPDVKSHVWVFFEDGDHTQPVYFAGAPALLDTPPERNEGNYPRNKVFKTKAGHLIEIDDTSGASRIHIKHKSGTEVTVFDSGDVEEYVVGDVTRTIMGSVTETILGDYTQIVMGNTTNTTMGTRNEMTMGVANYGSAQLFVVVAPLIMLN